MSLTLDIGATGMLAQQLNVDVISNNIANMTTTGYRRQRAQFRDLLYQTKVRPGATSADNGATIPSGIQQGLGVKAGSVYRINEQGALQQTGNKFDIATKGAGYFQITTPSGETAYTRDGSFQLDQNGQIVNARGDVLQPGITIPADALDVTINASGQVLVKLEGQTALSNVGQIQIAIFANEAGLEALGDNLLRETEASGGPVVANPGQPGYGTLEQGMLENSNVNIVQEMTNLIQAQRSYEMNSKVIQTGQEMLSTITQLR